MRRACLVAALALTGCALAGEPAGVPGTPEALAGQRAREALAGKLQVAADDVAIRSIEARTWSDSGMGCRAPGALAATVITEGYAVTAEVQGRTHVVHVSGENAVVCDKASGLVRREHPVAVRGIDTMMQAARKDLAQRLGVSPSSIRLGGMKAQQWPDSSLGCAQAGEKIVPGPAEGLVLTLRHAGRVYTYHTDRRTVRPCPAIEAE